MTRDYSTDRLPERALAAREAHRGYVASLEAAYRTMSVFRRQQGTPVLCVVGMGRAGKDTAAEFLHKEFGLAAPKSSSLNAKPLVAHMAGARTPAQIEEVYAERHQHRPFWIEACNALRADDLTTLARWCLGVCDHVVGIRGDTEFAAVVAAGMVDLTVWIDNDRVPADPTVEFMREDCDVVIDNHSTLERFQQRLARFGRTVYRRK